MDQDFTTFKEGNSVAFILKSDNATLRQSKLQWVDQAIQARKAVKAHFKLGHEEIAVMRGQAHTASLLENNPTRQSCGN